MKNFIKYLREEFNAGLAMDADPVNAGLPDLAARNLPTQFAKFLIYTLYILRYQYAKTVFSDK
ncbi:MAG: hypothetical protein GY795_26320 [Desulfobacterales bacterium]|nr:hypothetical protein [Desulfobacterales bacterium]